MVHSNGKAFKRGTWEGFRPTTFSARLARIELSAKPRYHIQVLEAYYTQSQPDKVVSYNLYNHPPHSH
jgi:hypothetical protein